MNRDDIKVGDVCILDESVAYSYEPEKPYEVIVLWHGINNQPLVTRTTEYAPFWTTYSQLTSRVSRTSLEKAILGPYGYPIEKWVWDKDSEVYRCPRCGNHAGRAVNVAYVKDNYKYCRFCGTELEV